MAGQPYSGNAFEIGANIGGDLLSSILKNAIYPQDSLKSAAVGLTSVVLGNFKWEIPQSIQILNNQLSSYTIYNEEFTNSIVKRQNAIQITCRREMDGVLNTYTTNMISSTLILKMFKDYTSNGGLFLMITPVGIIRNLAIQNLSITFEKANPIYNFSFIQLNVNSNNISKESTEDIWALCL